MDLKAPTCCRATAISSNRTTDHRDRFGRRSAGRRKALARHTTLDARQIAGEAMAIAAASAFTRTRKSRSRRCRLAIYLLRRPRRPRVVTRARSSRSSTNTSSGRPRPSVPWPSRYEPHPQAEAAAELAEEIAPKNILISGRPPSARRGLPGGCAAGAVPFIKVEASEFTEVGYVGRDVESMVRDLVELAVGWCARSGAPRSVRRRRSPPRERVLDLLLRRCARLRARRRCRDDAVAGAADAEKRASSCGADGSTTSMSSSRSGEDLPVLRSSPARRSRSHINVKDMLPGCSRASEARKLRVPEALETLAQEEEQKLIDMESVARAAVDRVQHPGYLRRRIDKVAGAKAATGRREP